MPLPMKFLSFANLLMLAVVSAETVEPKWGAVDRPWTGGDLWANPVEDWVVRGGRVENSFSGGNRNVVVLTASVGEKAAGFTIRCRVDQVSGALQAPGFVGISFGLQTAGNDFRDVAIHGSGLAAGLRVDGTLFLAGKESDGPKIPSPYRQITLELQGKPAGEGRCELSLSANDPAGRRLGGVTATVHDSWIPGLVAFVASSKLPPKLEVSEPRPAVVPRLAQDRGGEMRVSFDKLVVTGDRVRAHPERSFGPIWWTTHTISNDGSARILVQAAPFSRSERHDVTLIFDGKRHSSVSLDPVTRTALLTVRRLDLTKSHPYEVQLDGGSYRGTLRAVPKGRAVKLAALSCNDSTGFPHNELVANVAAHEPDAIAFLGDQIYEGIGGYGLIYDQRPNDRAILSYLRKYAMHGWTWREILKDIPSVTIPDDHDVFHGNLWGNGGKLADVSKGFGNSAQDSGGYKMSPEFVNMVHTTQTGNLPYPSDPTASSNNISVYFTRWSYGPFDVAIVGDRQFKTAPAALLPDGKIENGWPKNDEWYETPPPDAEGAELLGSRQEEFLARWAAKPDAATPIRLVLSQSPWAAPQTLPEEMKTDAHVPSLKHLKPGEYAEDDRPKPDFDTNGWPRAKRLVALEAMKQAGAFHVTGDQHLGTTGQYGLAEHRDGPWWVSTPATANVWPRRWMPKVEGGNRADGQERHLGDFADAFGNLITMHAVANPYDVEREPARLFDRAVGYTILTCQPESGRIEIANWPYWASPKKAAPDQSPYPGWPITIDPKTGARH
jgi:hypothetical protein